MKAKKSRKETPPGCRSCKWTGRVEAQVWHNGELVPAMKYCICPRGVWREQVGQKRDAGLPV